MVAYDALHQPLSPLFLDYLAGRAGASPFLGPGGFDLAAIAAAAERVGRPRAADGGRGRGARAPAGGARGAAGGGARAGARRARGDGHRHRPAGRPLRRAALRPVEGPGHDPGGAAARGRSAGAPVVPVFWVASDDHDFAEIRSTSLIDAGGAIRTLRYAPRHEPVGQPAWAIPLDDTIAALVEELGQALPAGPGPRRGARRCVAECYRPGVTLSEAFARLVSRLLPELVVLDPSDAALKRLMAPVMARELREGSPTSRLALEAGQRAARRRLPPAGAGAPRLPEPLRGRRRPAARARLRGRRRRGARHARAAGPSRRPCARLEARPARVEPRGPPPPPGPGRAAADRRLRGRPGRDRLPRADRAVLRALRHSRARRSLPRPSLTLVEPPQARALDAEQLTLGDLVGDPEALVSRWAREAYPDVEAAFARAREAIEREMGAVEEALGGARPDAARGHGRGPRAGAAPGRGRSTRRRCAPSRSATRGAPSASGGPATRFSPGARCRSAGLGLVGVLGRHGAAFLSVLGERLLPFARGHQVVRL